MTPAETSRGNAKPDPHGEASFGHGDHFAWVAWHFWVPFLFSSGYNFTPVGMVSRPLGSRPRNLMFGSCVDAFAFLPM